MDKETKKARRSLRAVLQSRQYVGHVGLHELEPYDKRILSLCDAAFPQGINVKWPHGSRWRTGQVMEFADFGTLTRSEFAIRSDHSGRVLNIRAVRILENNL